MQAAYQSDEFDDSDTPYVDTTSSDGTDEVLVDSRAKSAEERSCRQHLAPRTRRQARVDYTKVRIIPAELSKVCRDTQDGLASKTPNHPVVPAPTVMLTDSEEASLKTHTKIYSRPSAAQTCYGLSWITTLSSG